MQKTELYDFDIPTDARWEKSTYSNPDNCVEVLTIPGGVAIRDSKNPGFRDLRFSDSEFAAFKQAVIAGQF